MSEYARKRAGYINDWPKCKPFLAELNYKKRCDKFIEKYKKYPFQPMKVWVSEDDAYNRTISHLIDSLDMMPYHPNFAFQFAFMGLDGFSKDLYAKSTTANLKWSISDLDDLAQQNADVRATLEELFKIFPVNTSQYLYKCLYGSSNHNSNVSGRICTDQNNSNIEDHKKILDLIKSKYGYDQNNYNESIRKGALLYRKIFIQSAVTIENQSTYISNRFRLYLLLCGVIYSLRNDAMHGSSMSSTKSRLTTPKRYASNYYCFLATYTLIMIMLIKRYVADLADQQQKYIELKNTTLENAQNFKLLFRNHIR